MRQRAREAGETGIAQVLPDDLEIEGALITGMAGASAVQWSHLGAAAEAVPVAERVLRALRLLDTMHLGFPITQLQHGLQTATRAERAGADTEMIVAALCHDIGKVLPGGSHAAIAADMLGPYVRSDVCDVVRAHWFFQLRYTHQMIPGRGAEDRRRFRRKPWYALAERFSDEWDQASFDPEYDTLPLEHFENRIREVFGRRRYGGSPGLNPETPVSART